MKKLYKGAILRYGYSRSLSNFVLIAYDQTKEG